MANARPEVWNVEITDEYLAWFQTLTEGQQKAVRADIEILERIGPSLGRPLVDSVKGSKHSNMKELRTIHRRRAHSLLLCLRSSADRHPSPWR